ncbi:MAG: amidohydrolase family protein [Proteobacteria bacterium]|nr:amidohydrolase family protein [Pseudomonadota bacterium]
MTHEIVIRGGTIVDGTGNESFTGDVAVDGDVITEVGHVTEKGVREINANGAIVSPGFVDLHTHLDAQIGWDPMLTPISWHGVTTVLMGNCGVTFAPCKPGDKQFLAEMMETVEDIPREVILAGLPWTWTSYGEYLDTVEKSELGINVMGMVGHAAVRYYVMGARSIDENPTPAEIADIARVAGESVRDGAVGFSTNRQPAHRVPDGRPIPGTFAEPEELAAIARAVGQYGGIMQTVPHYGRPDTTKRDLELLAMEAREGNIRILFTCNETASWGYDDPHQIIEDYLEEGLEIYGNTTPRAAGALSGLGNDIMFPAFGKLREIELEKRLEAIQDEAFRNQLIEAARADDRNMQFSKNLHWLGNAAQPNYLYDPGDTLYKQSRETGEHPAEIWLRVMLENNGQTFFHMPFANRDIKETAKLLQRDWVAPGIGDAGAHVSMIMDADWATFTLNHWVKKEGLLTLENAIAKMTGKAARAINLTDRGELVPGQRADINVFDLDRLAHCQPEVVRDFPLGKARLTQRAEGYINTLVNGQVMLEDGQHTGARAGRVIRNNA